MNKINLSWYMSGGVAYMPSKINSACAITLGLVSWKKGNNKTNWFQPVLQMYSIGPSRFGNPAWLRFDFSQATGGGPAVCHRAQHTDLYCCLDADERRQVRYAEGGMAFLLAPALKVVLKMMGSCLSRCGSSSVNSSSWIGKIVVCRKCHLVRVVILICWTSREESN
jgi:hypothetical protein